MSVTLSSINKFQKPSVFPQILSVTETKITADSTSQSINIPATLNTGDLLVVFFTSDSTTITDPISVDAASSGDNWTHATSTVEASSVMTGIFYKIADAVDNSLTITTSDAQNTHTQVYRITNFYSTAPIKVSAVTSGTNEYPDPASLAGDYGADDYLWIVFYGADSWDSYATSAPADFIGLQTTYSSGIGGTSSCNTAYREYNVNGSYDPGTFTAFVNDETWQVYTIIINPPQ